MGEQGTKELVNRIVVKSGVEDPEKIMPMEDELDENGQPVQQQQGEPSMTPEMVQEIVGQMIQENDANDPNKDPIVVKLKTIAPLLDKVSSDAQRMLAQWAFGYEPTGPSPSDVRMEVEAAKLELDNQSQEVDHTLKVAQFAHTAQQAEEDNALKGAQFSHTVDQADKSHELAVKASDKPEVKK
jgi:hypothetical protein